MCTGLSITSAPYILNQYYTLKECISPSGYLYHTNLHRKGIHTFTPALVIDMVCCSIAS